MTAESSGAIYSTARQAERNVIAALLTHYKMYENVGLGIAALPRPVAECITMTDPATLRGITQAAAQRLVELDGLDTGCQGTAFACDG